MQKIAIKQTNKIEKRANCKLISANNRNFIIGTDNKYEGGMTADTITNDIIEFRVNPLGQQLTVQYKVIQLDNKLFTPRNSYAVCSSPDKIFIWGGLQVDIHSQKCLNDLIQFNVEKHTLRKYPLQNPFPIHSTVMNYDPSSNRLIAYGGTNENNEVESFLYSLDLNANSCQWSKTRIECKEHEGLIWQHSGHISQRSILNKQVKGNFLVVIGGCREPHSPYPYIVEIDLDKRQTVGSIKLDVGIVAQDSLIDKQGILYIFGGSIGGDFNHNIYRIFDGKYEKIPSYTGIGCACLQVKQGFIVYGGLCGMQALNSMILYKSQEKK